MSALWRESIQEECWLSLDANDEDEERPCELEAEGRIEKYIGVKVKASLICIGCIYVWAHFGSSLIIQDGVKQF